MRQIILIAHNLRSTHNVGSLFRTAEGLGIKKLYLSGYTPYPVSKTDDRLPHIARKAEADIAKTALGAETMVKWQHCDTVEEAISKLQAKGFKVVALEQSDDATALQEFEAPNKIAILVGREVEGIEPEVLKLCDQIIEIPMLGSKESFNVVQAAAMALYQFRFH